MTAWQLHATEPDTWQVFAPYGQCLAAIRPQAAGDDNLNCPGKDAAMGVIGRELQQHWPEAG